MFFWLLLLVCAFIYFSTAERIHAHSRNNLCLHATNWIRHRTADNLIIILYIGCVTKFQLIDLSLCLSLPLRSNEALKAQ